MKLTGVAKTIIFILIFLIAISLIQVYLIDSFRSDLPSNIEGKNSEIGWCLFFRCEKISYPSAAVITEPSMDIGFDAGPEDLKFGEIPIGGGGKRFVNVINGDETRAKVSMIPFGNISEYIRTAPNNFILESGETNEITVHFKSNTDMETGYYSGGVTLIRLSPKHELLDFLLGLV